jgi:hypothetical protein
MSTKKFLRLKPNELQIIYKYAENYVKTDGSFKYGAFRKIKEMCNFSKIDISEQQLRSLFKRKREQVRKYKLSRPKSTSSTPQNVQASETSHTSLASCTSATAASSSIASSTPKSLQRHDPPRIKQFFGYSGHIRTPPPRWKTLGKKIIVAKNDLERKNQDLNETRQMLEQKKILIQKLEGLVDGVNEVIAEQREEKDQRNAELKKMKEILANAQLTAKKKEETLKALKAAAEVAEVQKHKAEIDAKKKEEEREEQLDQMSKAYTEKVELEKQVENYRKKYEEAQSMMKQHEQEQNVPYRDEGDV